MFTDGNPTVHGVPASTSLITTNLQRVEEGIASANRTKSLVGSHGGNTRVVALGIGDALSPLNLAAISGPTAFSGSNAAAADYFTTGFDDLGETLGQIAKAQCGGTVTAVKEVKTGPNANDWALAPNWQFGVTPAAATTNPPSSLTGADGAVSFTYSAGPWPKTVTVLETHPERLHDRAAGRRVRWWHAEPQRCMSDRRQPPG